MGLVYDRIRWEEKSLIRASKASGFTLKPIDAKKVYINLHEGREAIEDFFGTVVLQRCVSYFRGLHVTSILENSGLTLINPFQVALTCGNKLFTTQALIKKGVPTPKTSVAFTTEGALKALDVMGYPTVLKPVVGSWGRLVTLVKDRESAKALIETREEIRNALLRIYYIQELVKRPPKDIRVIVIGDEVVAASYRFAPPDDWRTNVSRGGISKPCPLTPELEEIAVNASEAVGGGVLAVDCMEGPEGYICHEVNSTVEFQGLASTTNVDISKKILDYTLRMAKK